MGGRSIQSLAIMIRYASRLCALLVLVTTNVLSQDAVVSGSVLRSRVESWPEAQKARVLPFLNECRRTADRFVQIWPRQDVAEIHASFVPEQPISVTELGLMLRQMDGIFGSIRSVEFRSDSLLLTSPDALELLQRSYAQVDYAITTTKSKEEEYFFHIYLKRIGGMCRVVSFHYEKYLNAVPPWLKPKAKKDAA